MSCLSLRRRVYSRDGRSTDSTHHPGRSSSFPGSNSPHTPLLEGSQGSRTKRQLQEPHRFFGYLTHPCSSLRGTRSMYTTRSFDRCKRRCPWTNRRVTDPRLPKQAKIPVYARSLPTKHSTKKPTQKKANH